MNDYTLTDTFLIITKVTNIPNADQYFMASFDVLSLFTNVLFDETIDIIINTVFHNKQFIHSLYGYYFRKLLDFATKNMLFFYNDKV